MRRQPILRGVVRRPVSSAFTPTLNRAVDAEMRRYSVSRAFVLATCAAFALDVVDQPDYRDAKEGNRRSRSRRR